MTSCYDTDGSLSSVDIHACRNASFVSGTFLFDSPVLYTLQPPRCSFQEATSRRASCATVPARVRSFDADHPMCDQFSTPSESGFNYSPGYPVRMVSYSALLAVVVA
eukprot:COSAG02_NODE_5566_length_4225_cov_6.497576_4_plen_107_part_00